MSVLHRYTIMRIIEIDAGHRIDGHEGKCADFHGHRYSFEIYMKPKDGLDKLGRAIDFGVVKKIIGGWLDEYWDHGMLIWEKDEFAYLWQENGPLHKQKHFFLPKNPTAENLSSFLFEQSYKLLQDTDVEVIAIGCFETPNCHAYVED